MLPSVQQLKMADFYHSSGSSAFKVLTVLFPACFATFISLIVNTFLPKAPLIVHLSIEFAIIVVPSILTVTVFADALHYIVTTLLVLICVGGFLKVWSMKLVGRQWKLNEGQYKSYISNARGLIYLFTIICILAVDFPVFPRYFAKTLTYGYSLMDVGTGLFVVSTGLTASKPTILNILYSSSLLFIASVVRYLVTNATNYPTPVLEYGVHWNFFTTLALTKLIAGLIFIKTNIKYILILSIAIGCFNEWMFQVHVDWMFREIDRSSGFKAANREGIFSLLGYVNIHVLTTLLFGFLRDNEKYLSHRVNSLKKLISITCALAILAGVSGSLTLPCQRVANVSYVLWILFLSAIMLCIFISIDLIVRILTRRNDFKCFLFECLSFNGLRLFVIANVLTGVVNLSVDTKSLNGVSAICILLGYCFLSIFAGGFFWGGKQVF